MPRKFDFLSPGIEITEVDQSILPQKLMPMVRSSLDVLEKDLE